MRATYYLTDIADWPRLATVTGRVFAQTSPAATCVAVAALVDPAMRVEIEVTALRQ